MMHLIIKSWLMANVASLNSNCLSIVTIVTLSPRRKPTYIQLLIGLIFDKLIEAQTG